MGSWADLSDDLWANISEKFEDSLAVGDMEKKLQENDLRHSLNLNRQQIIEETTPVRSYKIKDFQSKYTHRTGGLSPLRSPIDKNRTCVTENSSNSRCSLQPSSSQYNPHYARQTRRSWLSKKESPAGDEDSPSSYISDRDVESGTPVISRTGFGSLSRQSWSRRRLHLPADNETEELNRSSTVEEDQGRLARREKDILYGRATDAYKKYVATIPKHLRSRDAKLHPRTPEKYKKCSRRSWDSQVKLWKIRLHTWAETQSDNKICEENLNNDKPKTQEIIPTDDDEFNLDDESFLDDVDINLDVEDFASDSVMLDGQ